MRSSLETLSLAPVSWAKASSKGRLDAENKPSNPLTANSGESCQVVSIRPEKFRKTHAIFRDFGRVQPTLRRCFLEPFFFLMRALPCQSRGVNSCL